MKEMKKRFNKIFNNTSDDYNEVIHQESYRNFIKKDGKFLMIKTNRGDLIFPGGRIEAGETGQQAASRELREETGYRSITRPEYIGTVISRKDDKFKLNCVFEIECHYYKCEVDELPEALELTWHELGLEIKPMWLTKDEIIRSNQEYADGLVVKDFWVDHVEWLLGEEWNV